ncbi:MAG: sulfite exporter TauE/SafE family protein [Phycisphaerales bacterium]
MDPALRPLVIFTASIGAGLLGSLTGLGGGVVVVPLLVLGFGVDLPFAVGASLIAVIATSCGSSATYLRDGYTNMRVAILLLVATVAGAFVGAELAPYAPRAVLTTLFGSVALWSAYATLRPKRIDRTDSQPDVLATRLRLNGTWPTKEGPRPYYVRGVPLALTIMLGAGMLSAMIGIGSGIVKVLAMDRVMRLPFKVSTSTSNFMIGVTAAASSGVYLHRGQLEPTLCAPVALGALAGSVAGARLLKRVDSRLLRVAFATVVGIAGVQMILKGVRW